jgi:hypothetical protein
MSKPAEIPQLVTDLVDMSKAYLQQETLDPLKAVGRYAGFSIGGGLLLAIGWLLLAIAFTRWITDVLPTGEIWEVAAYGIAAVVALMVAGVSMKLASRGKRTL